MYKDEDISNRSSSNCKADSSLKVDRETQDHSDGSDFKASIDPEDGEELDPKESDESDDDECVEDKNPNESLGFVQWILQTIISRPVGTFATEGNTVIPIGIQAGRPQSGFSIFTSLETYGYDALVGGWLDSHLKFTSHINERARRARTAEL